MLLSPRKNGLDSLFKEVGVFKVFAACAGLSIPSRQPLFGTSDRYASHPGIAMWHYIVLSPRSQKVPAPPRGSPRKFASQRALRGSLKGLCRGLSKGSAGVSQKALRDLSRDCRTKSQKKSLMSAIFPPAILGGGGSACANCMGAWDFLFSFCRTPCPLNFSFLGGVGVLWKGGEVPILSRCIFYLQLRSFYLQFVFFTYGRGTVSKKDPNQFPEGGNSNQKRPNPISRQGEP